MVLIIEQIVRWSILLFTGFATAALVRSYFTQANRYMDEWQRGLRFWYLVGFTGLFLHAGLMLWTQWEHTGKIFIW